MRLNGYLVIKVFESTSMGTPEEYKQALVSLKHTLLVKAPIAFLLSGGFTYLYLYLMEGLR